MEKQAAQSPYAGNIRKFYVFKVLVHFHLWLPIWVVYLNEERGISLERITAMEGPFWLALVLLEVPTGAVADRFGRKASLVSGAAIYTGALVAFGLADNYAIIFVSYLLWAVALTLLSGADGAFFYDTLRALGREGEYQQLWGRAVAIIPGAGTAGLLIGAPLAAFTELWVPIIVSSVLMLAGLVVSFTFVEPPRHDEDEQRLGFVANSKQAAKIAWSNRQVRWMLALAATVTASWVTAEVLIQPFLRSHEVGIGLFGLLLLPAQIVMVLAALLAYRVSAALGTRATMAMLPALVVVMAAAFGAIDALWIFVLYPIGALGGALGGPVVFDYLNRRIPSGQRATILSFQQLVVSLGLAVMLPAGGYLAEHRGMPEAYTLIAAAGAAVAAVVLVLWLRADRGEAEVSEEAPVPEPHSAAEPARIPLE